MIRILAYAFLGIILVDVVAIIVIVCRMDQATWRRQWWTPQ